MIGLGFLLFVVSATKTAALVSDPLNGTLTPKAIPGALVDYTITLTNGTGVLVDNNTTIVTDAIPAKTKLYVNNITGAGPVVFTAGLSGLSYTFSALNSATDDLEFSSNNGTSYIYTPQADSDGCDSAVTNIRVKTHGKFVATTSAAVRFRVMVK